MVDKLFAERLALDRFNDRSTKKPRSVLSIDDLSTLEIKEIIKHGLLVKSDPHSYSHKLQGKSIALLFEKTSTRTRCSYETGIFEMGGEGFYIDWKSSNLVLGRVEDETRIMSRYYSLIMARVYLHQTLEIMRSSSEVPLINGLCDLEHPCQALADYMTLVEYFKNVEGLNLSYIGDPNNVCRSLAKIASRVGIKMTISCPIDYPVPADITALPGIRVESSPQEAVKEADVIYTDTWVSMGQESEEAQRLKKFRNYQVNASLMSFAPRHCLAMHCLPAHPGQEITADVLTSNKSLVFDQAENRKHVQKALLAQLLN